MVLLYGSTTKAARCVHLISISSRNDQSLRDVTSMANGRRGRSGPTFFFFLFCRNRRLHATTTLWTRTRRPSARRMMDRRPGTMWTRPHDWDTQESRTLVAIGTVRARPPKLLSDVPEKNETMSRINCSVPMRFDVEESKEIIKLAYTSKLVKPKFHPNALRKYPLVSNTFFL